MTWDPQPGQRPGGQGADESRRCAVDQEPDQQPDRYRHSDRGRPPAPQQHDHSCCGDGAYQARRDDRKVDAGQDLDDDAGRDGEQAGCAPPSDGVGQASGHRGPGYRGVAVVRGVRERCTVVAMPPVAPASSSSTVLAKSPTSEGLPSMSLTSWDWAAPPTAKVATAAATADIQRLRIVNRPAVVARNSAPDAIAGVTSPPRNTTFQPVAASSPPKPARVSLSSPVRGGCGCIMGLLVSGIASIYLSYCL